jgi:GrpB-like predicted nucleotidyltransferase (UPF0157 family)
MRVHKQDCEKYESVKRELAQRYRYERKKYTDSKSDIFWEIIARADQWAANTGWDPEPSDA